MPKALLLVADGSEEIEFVTPYDGMFQYLHRIRLSSFDNFFGCVYVEANEMQCSLVRDSR